MNTIIFLLLAIAMSLVKANPQPTISIITSMYNGDEFIKGFMDDITHQTIFRKKNKRGEYLCELIIINANSPGHELETIRPYLKKHPNIVYRKLKKDPGIYATWNIAIKISRGIYITNANIDDRLAPDCLEVFAASLNSNPSVDFVYSDSYWTPIPNEPFEKRHQNQMFWSKYLINNGIFWASEGSEFTPAEILRGGISNHPMWRKSIHEKYGFFDETMTSAGDWDMWCRAYLGGSLFAKIPGIHGSYYCNVAGLSTTLNKEKVAKRDAEEAHIRAKYINQILAKTCPGSP